jgi:hypothetical protein
MMQRQVLAIAAGGVVRNFTLACFPRLQFVRLSGILKDYRIIGERLLRISGNGLPEFSDYRSNRVCEVRRWTLPRAPGAARRRKNVLSAYLRKEIVGINNDYEL